MAVNFYWWKREYTYTFHTVFWGETTDLASKLTNFLTQSHRSEQDSRYEVVTVQ
jgi:hypothetical protein